MLPLAAEKEMGMFHAIHMCGSVYIIKMAVQDLLILFYKEMHRNVGMSMKVIYECKMVAQLKGT